MARATSVHAKGEVHHMDGCAEQGGERLSEEVSRRLRDLEGEIPPSEIGELWVFPPLEEPEGSREFVLLTRYGGNGTRRLYSARVPPPEGEHREIPGPFGYTRERERETANGRDGDSGEPDDYPDQRVTEHGAMPAGRLPGLVQRFRHRLGDDRAPVHLRIGGRRERWIAAVGPETADGGDLAESDGRRSAAEPGSDGRSGDTRPSPDRRTN